MKRQLSDTTSSSTPEYKPVVEVATDDTIDVHNISGNTDESSDTAIQVNTSDDSANGDFESDDDSVEFEIDDVPVLIINEETKTLKKSITFGEVKAIIRGNIYLVSDVYGETRDKSAVNEEQMIEQYNIYSS